MSDLVINDVIINFTQFPFEPVTFFKNTQVESYAGNRQVFNNTEHDRREYNLNFSALTKTQALDIIDFFNARKGSYDDFLFEDSDYNFVSRVSIGTGTGALKTFQLIDAEGFERWDINETPIDARIWVNNVLQTKTVNYSIDYTESGIVTFVVAPTLAHDIEAEFYFKRRMSFVDDEQGYTHLNYNNLMLQGLRMREIIVP